MLYSVGVGALVLKKGILWRRTLIERVIQTKKRVIPNNIFVSPPVPIAAVLDEIAKKAAELSSFLGDASQNFVQRLVGALREQSTKEGEDIDQATFRKLVESVMVSLVDSSASDECNAAEVWADVVWVR